MGCDVLVDGYNVIKRSTMFRVVEAKDLAYARDVLIRQLKNRYRQSECRVTVVFDGDGDREEERHDDHIRIIFSRHDESADTVILRLAAQARLAQRSVAMYSDDSEVQQGVVQQRGNAYDVQHITDQVHAAPRDVAHRTLHRIKARRIYGIDPSYKPDDEPTSASPRGKKKKKAARRRGH